MFGYPENPMQWKQAWCGCGCLGERPKIGGRDPGGNGGVFISWDAKDLFIRMLGTNIQPVSSERGYEECLR
eukprot:358696-Chlamydomonas_euryale.AAC.3